MNVAASAGTIGSVAGTILDPLVARFVASLEFTAQKKSLQNRQIARQRPEIKQDFNCEPKVAIVRVGTDHKGGRGVLQAKHKKSGKEEMPAILHGNVARTSFRPRCRGALPI